MSQEELAAYAGIPTQYVRCVEDGRFDLLPDPVCARGYVRTYAMAVGLDQEAVTLVFTRLGRAPRFVDPSLAQLENL